MGDFLPTIWAIIDDHPIPLVQFKFGCHRLGHHQEMSDDPVIFGFRQTETSDPLFRDEEYMDRRLRIDIPDRHTVLVIMLNRGGNFPRYYFFKNSGFRHPVSLRELEYRFELNIFR